jgi:hypothetical protein
LKTKGLTKPIFAFLLAQVVQVKKSQIARQKAVLQVS